VDKSARAWCWCTPVGSFGYKVLEARPDKVKALVAVEADGRRRPQQSAVHKDDADSGSLRRQRQRPSRWSKIRQAASTRRGFQSRGRSIDVVDLPDAGLNGNSHMVMMDKNSDQVAELIQKWLAGKGLVE